MFERLLRDESGMTMGLAVITVVLIGVMGAGLLTFVGTDLNTVVEVNQGQKAFEAADAGVQAAKRQLVSDQTTSKYDGGTDDVQWSYCYNISAASCNDSNHASGMALNNLDGGSTTTDIANAAIKYDSSTQSFKVISTGEYDGEAKRKIEAVFHSSGSGGGGIPAYYTPGGMRIKKDALGNGMSFFAGGNIELRSGATYGDSNDVLGDWNKTPYNTTPRKNSTGTAPFTKTGVAAEGYVCDEGNCGGPGSSIADGVRIYDSTTGSKGNRKKFVKKDPPTLQPQDSNTITYPFPRVVNVNGLLQRAKSGAPNVYDNTSPYDDIPSSTTKRVHFIDAGGSTVRLDKSFTFKGVLVIRCGNLDLKKNPTIEGIIIVIKGEGSGCSGTGTVNIRKDAVHNGPVYAESSIGRAIDMERDADIGPLLAGYEEFSNLAYSSSVELASWRELYQ